MRLDDIKDPKQRAMFARAAGITAPGTIVLHAQAGMTQALPLERSPLEVLFLQRWTDANGPLLEEEVELVPEKKYRCDFVHMPSQTVIEIQGFTDHASRKGFERDAVKFLELYLLGYTVVILIKKTLTADNIARIVARLKRKI